MYQKLWSYAILFLRYGRVTDLIIFHFGLFFALLPPEPPKKTKYKKKKKKKHTHTPGDIILHMCAKNHDHMLYCYWDMACGRYNSYFSFWAIICPFNRLTAQKINFYETEKNAWRYHHFTYVYQKLWSDNVRFLRYGARRTTDTRTDGWTDGKSDI